MVNLMANDWVTVVAAGSDTVLEKLEPERRAAVVLALVGLVLLGISLVVITMFAGRWARHDRPRRNIRFQAEPRAKARQPQKNLTDAEARYEETIVNHPGDDDTKA